MITEQSSSPESPGQPAASDTSWLPPWPVWQVPVALSLFTGLLQLGGTPIVTALRYDRMAVEQGQWWRLLSGNFVHLGFWHWLLNVISLILLAILCRESISLRVWGLRIGLLAAGVGLGLHFCSPGLTTFVGLSGMIYGMFLLGLGPAALDGDRVAWGCVVILFARVGWELVVGVPASEEDLVGGAVIPMSHVYGMVSALVCWGLLAMGAQLRRR